MGNSFSTTFHGRSNTASRFTFQIPPLLRKKHRTGGRYPKTLFQEGLEAQQDGRRTGTSRISRRNSRRLTAEPNCFLKRCKHEPVTEKGFSSSHAGGEALARKSRPFLTWAQRAAALPNAWQWVSDEISQRESHRYPPLPYGTIVV